MLDRSTPHARGLAPLAGVVLVLVTFCLAATVSGAVLASGHDVSGDLSPRVSLSLAVDGDSLALTHRGGDALDVTALRLVVTVDGEPLAHQPPVPFFSARGFHPGPTGPFNSAADPRWAAGETASVRVAGTNQPTLEAGGTVTVRVYVDDALVAEASTRTAS
ncbi:type IV pilin [Salinigranum rubrum]|uniref:Type IV pilin n=1 Tax=Salinigranum rubrum TaxID=755307 RepID=A0A2I8VEU0_9EURY|nr:type IV pilin N-terminal domain-containing protein [Salinigranum rubrum]AUV80436.1 type IV pilin [Salinigranum rubrum]